MNNEPDILKQTPVVFNEEQHTYYLNGKQLSGITAIIEKYICPAKYSGVQQRTMEAAKQRGKEIHNQCRMIIDGFGYKNPAPEVNDFFDKMRGTYFVASEYLVSDEQNFASAIDAVDANFNLYDFKSTSRLDTEYLRWQLSIYAYFFELQNPGKKAGDLFGVWLRNGAARVVKIERIAPDIIVSLLQAAATGADWFNPLTKMDANKKELQRLIEVEKQIIDFENKLKQLQQQETELKAGILERMLANGVKTWETDRLKFTAKSAYKKTTFAAAKFKAENPALYEKYCTESVCNASLIIKVKDNESK